MQRTKSSYVLCHLVDPGPQAEIFEGIFITRPPTYSSPHCQRGLQPVTLPDRSELRGKCWLIFAKHPQPTPPNLHGQLGGAQLPMAGRYGKDLLASGTVATKIFIVFRGGPDNRIRMGRVFIFHQECQGKAERQAAVPIFSVDLGGHRRNCPLPSCSVPRA